MALARQQGDQAALGLTAWNQGVLLLRTDARCQGVPLLHSAVQILTTIDHPAAPAYAAQLTALTTRWAALGWAPRLLDGWDRRRSADEA